MFEDVVSSVALRHANIIHDIDRQKLAWHLRETYIKTDLQLFSVEGTDVQMIDNFLFKIKMMRMMLFYAYHFRVERYFRKKQAKHKKHTNNRYYLY